MFPSNNFSSTVFFLFSLIPFPYSKYNLLSFPSSTSSITIFFISPLGTCAFTPACAFEKPSFMYFKNTLFFASLLYWAISSKVMICPLINLFNASSRVLYPICISFLIVLLFFPSINFSNTASSNFFSFTSCFSVTFSCIFYYPPPFSIQVQLKNCNFLFMLFIKIYSILILLLLLLAYYFFQPYTFFSFLIFLFHFFQFDT